MGTVINTVCERHLFHVGPKRILALDGGGVRGIVSLAFLERLEAILKERTGRIDFRLADYFDLIGGTSTGALIAGTLAIGYSTAQLIELYLNLGTRGFRRSPWYSSLWAAKFDGKALRAVIMEHFGSTTLGSDKIRCGLGIVAKRLDTGSVWLFHNHPRGPFFAPEHSPPELVRNADLLLSDLLRASTAAPSYFAPELIEVGPGVRGLFVDGGVSPHANPALLLLTLATLKGYGFRWPLGAERLMLTSVGTGATSIKPKADWVLRRPAIMLAIESLRSVMDDSDRWGQTLLQWMSDSPTPWIMNGEVGDLKDDIIGGNPFLRYLRYDAPLSDEWLERILGLQLQPEEVASLREMDRPENMERLLEIGRQAAEKQIKPDHFPARFDEYA